MSRDGTQKLPGQNKASWSGIRENQLCKAGSKKTRYTEYQSSNSMHELQSQIDLGLTPILSPDLVERLSFTTTRDSLPHSGAGPARYVRYTISFNLHYKA